MTAEAKRKDGALKPDCELGLEEGQSVRLEITPAEPRTLDFTLSRVDTWAEIQGKFSVYAPANDGKGKEPVWVFRGVSSAHHGLLSSFDRIWQRFSLKTSDRPLFEEDLVREFQRHIGYTATDRQLPPG